MNDRMDIGQKLMIGVVVVVVFVGGYFVFKPTSPEANVEEVAEVSPAAFESVSQSGVTYMLDGVHWVFEPQSIDESGAPTTRVRLQLDGFRRNNSPIEVGMYRLGTYRGQCAAQPVTEPTALAEAVCTWNGTARQLAAFQEGELVIVKVRAVSGDGTRSDEYVPILTIDLATIIQ